VRDELRDVVVVFDDKNMGHPASRFPLPASRFLLPATRFLLPATRFVAPASASSFPSPESRVPSPESAIACRACPRSASDGGDHESE
jgi:hypothetical protein